MSDGTYFLILKYIKSLEVSKTHKPSEKSLLSHWDVLWLNHLVLVHRAYDTIYVLEEFFLFDSSLTESATKAQRKEIT